MIQIRIHGRGGQGVVTAAELLASAAFLDGLYAQAFPLFGVERSGAPVQSFVRLDKKPIITREQIYRPDILIIQDDSLLATKEILAGIKPNSILIINSRTKKIDLASKLKNKIKRHNIYPNPATEIALELLGKNLVNTVILGSFAQVTKLISLKSLLAAITDKFADKGKEIINKNKNAVLKSYQYEEKE